MSYNLENQLKNIISCLLGLAGFCGLSYPFLWWKLKKDPIMWIFNYLVGNQRNYLMLSIWIICILCAFLIVKHQSSKATTINRKYFHALVVIVYTSGILIDVNFLYLSSIVSLCIMVRRKSKKCRTYSSRYCLFFFRLCKLIFRLIKSKK